MPLFSFTHYYLINTRNEISEEKLGESRIFNCDRAVDPSADTNANLHIFQSINSHESIRNRCRGTT